MGTETSGKLGAFIICVILISIGFAIGLFVSDFQNKSHWEAQAIEHNCAQYHPQTGEFEWREE